jgi:hypothetical protein
MAILRELIADHSVDDVSVDMNLIVVHHAVDVSEPTASPNASAPGDHGKSGLPNG